MNGRQRYSLMKSVLGVLCGVERPGVYATFENADHPDEYLQVARRDDGALLAEVGSREWVDPTRPLGETAKQALAELGFAGGAPERNYVNESVTADARSVAQLLVRAFDVAYRRRGADLVVKTNCAELETWLRARGMWVARPAVFPVAEPVHLGMIRAALNALGWRVFHDEAAGCLMTWWGWHPDVGQGLKVQYEVSGEAPWRVLSVFAIADNPVLDAGRPGVLELINEWNDSHRWPCATLSRVDGHDFSWLELRWSVPVGAGMCQAMVTDVVRAVSEGALECLRWLHTQRSNRGVGVGSVG